jgi:hypothetical protein
MSIDTPFEECGPKRGDDHSYFVRTMILTPEESRLSTVGCSAYGTEMHGLLKRDELGYET